MIDKELYKKAFAQQKNDAKRHGNSWELTLEKFIEIWESSGHWHERGTRKTNYIMVRVTPDDVYNVGPYAVGNVKIVNRSENNRIVSLKRVAAGTHNFLGGKLQRKRVADGTHNLLDGELSRKLQQQRVTEGTHPFLNSEFSRNEQIQRLKNNTHNLQKLTEDEVVQIKKSFKGGPSIKKLAHMFGVCRQTICNIHSRRTWKHVFKANKLDE